MIRLKLKWKLPWLISGVTVDQDWSLAESDTDAIQLERIGVSNHHHTGRGSKLTKLNRKNLKDAVIYSEILKPKYQSK